MDAAEYSDYKMGPVCVCVCVYTHQTYGLGDFELYVKFNFIITTFWFCELEL